MSKRAAHVKTLRTKAQEPGAPMSEAGGDGCSSSRRERVCLSFPFCSKEWLYPPHWWGPFSLLSLPNQMLISSRSTVTDTPRKEVIPAICSSLGQLRWEAFAIIQTRYDRWEESAFHNPPFGPSVVHQCHDTLAGQFSAAATGWADLKCFRTRFNLHFP